MGIVAIIILAALLVLVLVWVAVCFGLSVFSGWRRLAARFRATEPAYGVPHHHVPAQIGRLDYGSTLTVYLSAEGLFLAPMLLLKPGHPRLFIPWSAFSEREELRFTRRPAVRLAIGAPVLGTIVLPQRLFDEQRG